MYSFTFKLYIKWTNGLNVHQNNKEKKINAHDSNEWIWIIYNITNVAIDKRNSHYEDVGEFPAYWGKR